MALSARPYTIHALAPGLSSAEAAGRLAADGPNVLPSAPRVLLWRRVAAQLRALWGHATGRPWQSMAFFALGATQLGSRARPGTQANPMLPVAVAVALGLQLAGLYLPPLRDLLHTVPLTGTDLVVVCPACPSSAT